MAYRGKYIVKYKDKYLGDFNKVTYRSSWELKYAKFLDLSSHVISWSSEEVIIPYFCPTDGKMHRYFMDFYVKTKSSTGVISEHLVEIKPNKERKPPRKNKNQQRFIKETLTYVKNQAKWKAATIYANKLNMKFLVLDEFDLGISKRKKNNAISR